MYANKNYKRLIVSISILIILAFIIITFYISEKPSEYTTKNTITVENTKTIENVPIWERTGIIVHRVDNEDFWGLQLNFWERPFGPKRLRIKYLPEEFKIENLKVKVKYGKSDVVGTSDWNVIIDIIDIQKI